MAGTEIRRLRAPANDAMVQRQTEDVDRAAGTLVVSAASVAQLVAKDALVYDAAATNLLANVDGVDEAYLIVRRGIEMLREARELWRQPGPCSPTFAGVP